MATSYQEKVWALVRMIDLGQVASYGMIASLLPGVTARMVGYAMAATPNDSDIPWQRVINSAGKISGRPGMSRQRAALEAEGVVFSKAGKIRWSQVGWNGPDADWLQKNGIEIGDFLTIKAGWPS